MSTSQTQVGTDAGEWGVVAIEGHPTRVPQSTPTELAQRSRQDYNMGAAHSRGHKEDIMGGKTHRPHASSSSETPAAQGHMPTPYPTTGDGMGNAAQAEKVRMLGTNAHSEADAEKPGLKVEPSQPKVLIMSP